MIAAEDGDAHLLAPLVGVRSPDRDAYPGSHAVKSGVQPRTASSPRASCRLVMVSEPLRSSPAATLQPVVEDGVERQHGGCLTIAASLPRRLIRTVLWRYALYPLGGVPWKTRGYELVNSV